MLFDAVSGKVLFSYHDTGEDSLFRGWASISNGVLYIGNANGKLYAFAPEEASTGLTLQSDYWVTRFYPPEGLLCPGWIIL